MTEGKHRGSGLRTGTLILATITTGLTAGVFTHWSNTIMPALDEVDDRTFVEAYRELDAAITNPFFLGVEFMGALLLTGLAVFLHFRSRERAVLLWTGAALVCYLVAVVVTFGVNEPLNEDFRTAADSGGADLAALRAELDTAKWAVGNAVRAVASTLAFGFLAWALVIHHRPEAPRRTRPRVTPGP